METKSPPKHSPQAAAAAHPKTNRRLHPEVLTAQAQDILSVLLALRFINALCVRTFFQPDEYFQALEPAWTVAFGSADETGAWLTWEWQHQLRSSLHPALFGLVYKAVHSLMAFMNLFPPFQSFVLVALPKVVQSIFAALADYYTWRLATEIYGRDSNFPWAALWMTVLNPWQWYCSTRTFSNSLEATLTIAALYYWPWQLLGDARVNKDDPLQSKGSVNSLRLSLALAAVAVLLRPTNILIWIGILTLTLTRLTLDGEPPLHKTTLVTFTREILVCGTAVLALSLVSDRLYFGFWTFPPYTWLYFNISQSLAVFYGQMPWHYYLSQGLPLLTTSFLPFALVGLYKSTSTSKTLPVPQSNILKTLAFAVLTMLGALSIISHKEVRFIYPLLPILHILAAPYITSFFTEKTPLSETPTNPTPPPQQQQPQPIILRHRVFLANLLSLNILLAGYLTLYHQAAPISVLNFLRTDYERIHPDSLTLNGPATSSYELFALFLTPCHSTPWRSHLVWPGLHARALTCEPPLATAPGSVERATYLDEADRFYAKDDSGRYGVRFLDEEMWPSSTSAAALSPKWGGSGGGEKQRAGEMPRYIVGFEGIESVLKAFFEEEEAPGRDLGVKLTKVWEGWNGAFNEDWRRTGRLVVWDTGVYEGSFGSEAAGAEGSEDES
ncbi:Alg9-like mannosyltransferase family-domain-containing protein [Cercophora scortea]|uniref:Mannosyltransferase n=1 Tax=Cercophora scortea TaxID=314031 RepID=A0AAE0MIK1_9PEZI|nr:Alg9-like mannosyltransferase family-domain-containing protein [Cercophora scortea]